MDVSSDLIEFGRTPVAVISAGPKSILDIPRTLEYLVLQLFSQQILVLASCNCISYNLPRKTNFCLMELQFRKLRESVLLLMALMSFQLFSLKKVAVRYL